MAASHLVSPQKELVEQHWILTDTSQNISTPDFMVEKETDSGEFPDWKIVKKTLQGGVSEGVEVIEINNGKLFISLLPTRGMGISHAELNGIRLGWGSRSQRPVHPRHVSFNKHHGKGWLDGFSELMCRCGLESNGAPVFDGHTLIYPLHGKIANMPASFLDLTVDNSSRKISVRGVVEETSSNSQKLRLISSFTTDFNSHTFQWSDRVENLSDSPATMQMIYHINIGSPILEEGAKLIAPVKTVSPYDDTAASAGVLHWRSYDGPNSHSTQHSFLVDLLADSADLSHVLLKNRAGDLGVSIRFNKSHLPYFTLWRSTTPETNCYVTALEPGTNFPNPRPFEEKHERVVRLKPRGSWTTTVGMDLHISKEQVEGAQAAINLIQGSILPILNDQPLPDWSTASVSI